MDCNRLLIAAGEASGACAMDVCCFVDSLALFFRLVA
ncbi:Uncharacterised protein [uncultured archaeon]|nr:Uncharacterised protein [uncultured archaeon]